MWIFRGQYKCYPRTEQNQCSIWNLQILWHSLLTENKIKDLTLFRCSVNRLMSRELPFFSWEVACILYGRMEIPCCFSWFSELQSSGITCQTQQSSVPCQGRYACSVLEMEQSKSQRSNSTPRSIWKIWKMRWGSMTPGEASQTDCLPGRSLPFEILPLGFTLRPPIFSFLLDQWQLLLVFVCSLHQESLCRALEHHPSAQGLWLPRVLGKNISSSAFSNFLYTICSLLFFQINLSAAPAMAPKQNLDVQSRQNINTFLIYFVKEGLKREKLGSVVLSNLLNVST